MNKQVKNIVVFLVAFFGIVCIVVYSTFSLFESNVVIDTSNDIAKWNIKVNNAMITSGGNVNNEFDIGSISWQNGGHVRQGKAAPGSVGSFEIIVDPTDTQVSFTYQIEFDTSSLHNDEFKIQNVREVNGHTFIRTGVNTYVGIARLSEFANNGDYDILVDVVWTNNDNNNENDYQIGVSAGDGVYIPVNIEINQYFGTEVFVPYVEPQDDDDEEEEEPGD